MPNFFSIAQKISKSPKAQKFLADAFIDKVESEKERTLEEFDNHDVTQELKSGPDGGNDTGSLGGYGNLFSFIGFQAGEDPTEVVREILAQSIEGYRTPLSKEVYKNGQVKFKFRVRVPDLKDFEEETPYPGDPAWRNGSWLYGIEHGIYGLESYLFDEDFGKYEQSRSSTGLQAKGGKVLIAVRSAKYRNMKYMSEILRNFVRNLKNS